MASDGLPVLEIRSFQAFEGALQFAQVTVPEFSWLLGHIFAIAPGLQFVCQGSAKKLTLISVA